MRTARGILDKLETADTVLINNGPPEVFTLFPHKRQDRQEVLTSELEKRREFYMTS
jgi:hypothetical protein